MKYLSCHLAEHGICFIADWLWSCCYSPSDKVEGKPGPVVLIPGYKGELIDTDELFKIIEIRRDHFKKGLIPPSCQGCYHLEEKDWPDENFIDQVYITHFERCNADCFYCSSRNGNPAVNADAPYSVLPVLRDLKEKNVWREGGEIHIGGGEPTLYSELDTIIRDYAFTEFCTGILVPTSAILYSPTIAEGLKNNTVRIIVSLDSGTRDTYFKIKRVDKFNNVVDTLRKYAAEPDMCRNILMKYIAVQGVNDNEKEFIAFLDLCENIGVKSIAVDIEAMHARSLKYGVDRSFIDRVINMEHIAKNRGFATERFMFLKHSLNLNNINV